MPFCEAHYIELVLFNGQSKTYYALHSTKYVLKVKNRVNIKKKKNVIIIKSKWIIISMLFAFTSLVTENLFFLGEYKKKSNEFEIRMRGFTSFWNIYTFKPFSFKRKGSEEKKTFVIFKPKAHNKCILLGWLMCIEGRVMLHDRRLGASAKRNTESPLRANQKVTLPVTNPKLSNCLFWLAAWRQSEHSDWLQSKGVLIEIYCFR